MAPYLLYFLKVANSVFIISLLLFLPALCKASPWLPEPGHYKFFSGIALIDQQSINRRKIREEIYLDAQRMMYELGELKAKILNQILFENRIATNNERRTLEQIDKEVEALALTSSDQKAYRDDKMSNILIEYGVSEKYSFGIKVDYKSNKLVSYPSSNVSTSGNNVDVFLKYKLFDKDNWIIAVQPKLYTDKYGNFDNKLFQEIGFMVGYSKDIIAEAVIFSEVGIFAANLLSNKWNRENILKIGFTEGIKLKNGIIFYNFLQYYSRKIDNRIYGRSLYEQISVAKEIGFDRLKRNNFTISAGYFFDQSLVDRSFKVFGPVFSLWFNI